MLEASQLCSIRQGDFATSFPNMRSYCTATGRATHEKVMNVKSVKITTHELAHWYNLVQASSGLIEDLSVQIQ